MPHPDFGQPGLRHAPDGTFVPAPGDGVLPRELVAVGHAEDGTAGIFVHLAPPAEEGARR